MKYIRLLWQFFYNATFKIGFLAFVLFLVILYILWKIATTTFALITICANGLAFLHPAFDSYMGYAASSLLLIGAIYLFGVVVQKQESRIEALLGKVPLFKKVWKFVLKGSEIIQALHESCFVKIKDWPSAGADVWGAVSRMEKEHDADGNIFQIRPRIIVPTPPSPASGYIVLPERHKIRRMDIQWTEFIEITVSCGFSGATEPRQHPNQKKLDEYYDEKHLKHYYNNAN